MSHTSRMYAQRFGGRFDSGAPSTEPTPAMADLMAQLWSVSLGTEATKSTCDVLAFDDEQAERFARRRFHFLDDTTVELVELREIGAATSFRDRTEAVLRVETIDERDARFQRWENLNADAYDAQQEADFAAHHGGSLVTPDERMAEAYRMKREGRR